jgi:Ca-activated chloride channel homolog
MTLQWEHADFLWALWALPAVWLFVAFSRAMGSVRSRLLSAAVRSSVLALLLIALAQPVWRQIERHELPVSVVLVRDRSASVLPAEREADGRQREYVEALSAFGPAIRIDFARTAQLTAQAPPPGPEGTNIELALERARAELPSDSTAAVLLLTDGRSTAGDALRSAARLRAQGAIVHTVSVGTHVQRGPTILGVEPPATVRLGQPARFLVRVGSDGQQPFPVRLMDGKSMEADHATAPGGRESAVVLRYIPKEAGFQNCQVLVTGPAETPGEQTLAAAPIYVEGPPKALIVDTLPDESKYLLDALAGTHITFDTKSTDAIPDYPALSAYDAVILNDCARLSAGDQENLVRYVRETGGGLIFVGGANVRVKAWRDSPLEAALPVELLPEQIKVVEQSRPVHVCFVLDKSGSMEAPLGGAVSKIDMVKAAVQRSVAELPAAATVSVVVFDAQTRLLVPPTPISKWGDVSANVDALAADGGTMMDTGLEEGIRLLQGSQNAYLILLTDGLTNVSTGASPEARWNQLAARIRHAHIALTTVALGQEADRALLNKLAWNTRGASYDCQSADQVPRIFIKEAQTIKQQARAVTVPFAPQAGPAVQMIRGIPTDAFPRLLHAIPAQSRDMTQIVLTTDKGEPLLAVGHEGLGTIVAFTADAKPTWARQWLGWTAFARFWNQVLGWAIRSPNRIQAEVKPVVDGADVRVLLRATDEEGRPARGLKASGSLFSASAPDETPVELSWQETRPGVYEGHGVTPAAGNHLCRIQLATPEATVLSHCVLLNASNGAELAQTGPDQAALRAIAQTGGGSLNPAPRDVAEQLRRSQLREITVTHQLWLRLVIPALLLWLIDVLVRRLGGSVPPRPRTSA